MEIKCNYQTVYYHQSGSMYSCNINSASITEPNQEINSFVGIHQYGKNSRDVEAICFYQTEVHYMPRGINKAFPNLKVIYYFNCGLKEITRDDLFGLKKIEGIYLGDNELKSLPDNLLEGMTKLKWINFSNNKIEFVSFHLFLPVLGNQLTYVGFRKNPTIDAVFDASKVDPSGFHVDLPGLMKLFEEKCKKPPKDENQIKPSTSCKLLETFKDKFMQGVEEMWTSGQFSDFTIVVGDQKFSVHKNVLAMQSEFFAETFKKAQENSVAELKIEDLSAEVVEEVLRWMYTGEDPDVKNALEVFALVMKLKIFGLKEIAENLVSELLNQENAIEVYKLGHSYESEKLKDLAYEEIKKFLGQPDLNENLKNELESLRKLVKAKKSFEVMLEKLNKI